MNCQQPIKRDYPPVYRGSTWRPVSVRVQYTGVGDLEPRSLAGCTVECDFVSISGTAARWSTFQGDLEITIDTVESILHFAPLPSLLWPAEQYQWDLFVTWPDNVRKPIARGTIQVEPNVTTLVEPE